jgi:F0F1-type ATP synthase assembly protein I
MAFFKRNSNRKGGENNLSKYTYYSGMGFQMIAIIGVFTFIGYKVDQSMGNQKDIFTALLSLLGVCISLYSVIKTVNKQ